MYELQQEEIEAEVGARLQSWATDDLDEGDISAFRQGEPLYADMTEAPKTLMEAQNMIIRITDEFNNLPVEVRAKFDHSPEKYVALYGGEAWAKAVGYEIKKADTGEIQGTGDVSTEPIPKQEAKA